MAAKTFEQILSKDRIAARFKIIKSDDSKRQVFGWASVAVNVGGQQITDWQEDVIDPDELEKAAYDFTANFGTAGEMHEREGVGQLIESIVFTKEKTAALSIPDGILPAAGWWTGFKINDDEVWQKIKDGSYSMF